MSADTNPRSGLENAVFGASVGLVTMLVARLVFEAFAGPSGPPDVRAVALSEPGDTFASVTVQNRGGTVAEAVRVEVCEQFIAGREIVTGACAEVELPYLPAKSTRKATVGFAEPPRQPLRTRVVSYLEP